MQESSKTTMAWSQASSRTSSWCRRLSVVCAMVLVAASSARAVNFPEVEANDSKATATPVVGIAAGDTITGNSISAVTTGLDYFRVKTGALALGIYRHQLAITTAGTAGHIGTLRGLSQSGGVITAGSDIAFVTSSTATTPPRMVQWYGFGNQEEVYYRVTGAAATTMDYVATLTTAAVTPVSIGTFPAGTITISFCGQGHTTDTDMWIWDGGLNAIPCYGSDDVGAACPTAGLNSILTRSYAPGTYYMGVSRFEMGNNLPSPTIAGGCPNNDSFLSGFCTDFPNNAMHSGAATGGLNIQYAVTSSSGTVVVPATIPTTPTTYFNIYWATFTVVPATALTITATSAAPSAVLPGGSSLLTVTVSPATMPPSTGIAVTGNLSSIGGSPTQAFLDDGMNGDVTANDNTFSYMATVAPATTPGLKTLPVTATDMQGGTASGSVALTVQIQNDSCANAGLSPVPPITNPCGGSSTVSGDYSSAIADTPATSNCTCDTGLAQKDVYHSFTPAVTGLYTFSLCTGSVSTDTVISVHTNTCPVTDATQVTAAACNDDGCAPLSLLTNINLTMGTTYIVRVAGWSSAVAGGAYTLTTTLPGSAANDACAGAIALSGTSGSASGDLSCATNDGAATCDPAAGLFDTWYTFTTPAAGNCPAAGTLTLNTCGSATDTVLAVYTGACGALVEVGCNDTCGGAPCGGTASCLTVATSPSTVYRIRVANAAGPGPFTLNYNFTIAGGAPANDLCANAEALTAGTYTRSNCGAGTDGTATCGAARTSDVWFSYTSPCDYTAIIDTCGTHDLPGADLGIDTVVSVYTGACGALTQVTCNDDYFSPVLPFGGCVDSGIIRDSAVSVALTFGQTVIIRVGSFSTGPQGTFILRIQAAPVVTILSANPPNLHRDTLQNTDTSLNPQGIGVAGTPDEGAVMNYDTPQVMLSAIPSPAPSPANITTACTGGTCPTVTAVADLGGGLYELTLSGQIPVLHCITLTFACTAAGQKLQYSFGPGDINLNGTITGQDVLAEVTAINTSTTILARHDTNRNGTVTGQDVLRLVQLLNGGVTVSPNTGFNGSVVAACP